MKAVLRVKQILDRSQLGMANAHGQRRDQSIHVDRSRSHLNRFWVPPELALDDPSDLTAAVDALTDNLGATLRKGAGIAAEFLTGASPTFFLYDDGREGFDPAKIDEWMALNIAVFQERYPDQIAQVRLDMDETTPHLAIFVVPTYRKKTKHTESLVVSYRKVIGGSLAEASIKLIAMQDWYGDAMAPLGLERGTPREITKAKHKDHRVYSREEARKSAATQVALDEAEAIRDDLLVLRDAEQLELAHAAAARDGLERERAATEAERLRFETQNAQLQGRFQQIVRGFRRAAELLASNTLSLSGDNKVRTPQENWPILKPVLDWLTPIIRTITDLRAELEAERRLVKAERQRLAELKAQLDAENAAARDVLQDLLDLRSEMSTEQLDRLAATEEDITPSPSPYF